jgi:hypothetical protein
MDQVAPRMVSAANHATIDANGVIFDRRTLSNV